MYRFTLFLCIFGHCKANPTIKIEKMKKEQKPTETNTKTGLTPLQEKGAILLANGESLSSVAEQLQINRTTLYDWKKSVTFQCFYNQQCKEAKENLTNGLNGLYKQALETLNDILLNGNDNARLKVALKVIANVESRAIGETEPRNILKKEATETKSKLDFLDYNDTEVIFDNAKYKRLLKENGLD